MNEIIIEKQNFERAINRLKDFSEKKEAELIIDRVKTDGGFLWLGNHKVTGEELNSRLEIIQKHLIDINTTNNQTIKEFREVYNALEALDKDYIDRIVASVMAIEKTSNDVRMQQEVLSQHNNELQKQQNKLNAHQGEIDKIIVNINKTVAVLKSFKEKLEGLNHLTDIDNIWSDCKTIHNEVRVIANSLKVANESQQENVEKIEALSNALTIAEHEIEALFKKSNAISERLESVISFKTTVEQIIHLKDVDKIWENTENHQHRIKDLEQESKKHTDIMNELVQVDVKILERIDSNAGDINHLKEYKKKLSSISHIEDVDEIWEDVEKHTSQLTESKERDEELTSAIQKNKEEVVGKISDLMQTTNATVESLTRKIKYAYWIAGGTAGLAIIELILLLVKVM
ncbi:MAG: hypothetical protein M3Z34_08805 [Staphylococcus epidermidis]|nr:hypothetical protein [Staphylococcus epidermidis]